MGFTSLCVAELPDGPPGGPPDGPVGVGTQAGHRPGQEGDISQNAKSQPIFKLPPQISQSEMAGPTSKVASDLKLIEFPTSTIHCMGPTPLPCAEFASQRPGVGTERPLRGNSTSLRRELRPGTSAQPQGMYVFLEGKMEL